MNCTCKQCGHSWWARGTEDDANAKPKRCPSCMTTAWDRDKKKAGRPRNKAPEQPGLRLEMHQEPPEETEMPARPPTMCPHNRPVGSHCWQCKGVAKEATT